MTLTNSIEFRELQEEDFPEWVAFHDKAYGKSYVLTDKDFLHWYLRKEGKYETLIALDKNKIVGAYGVLLAPLKVKSKIYNLCWWVSGMVLPEYRGQGIGQTFVKMSLERFDVCGGIGFNVGVRKNYVRFGLNQFDGRTLRRFVLIVNSIAYSLIKDEYREELHELLPVMRPNDIYETNPNGFKTLRIFDNDYSCVQSVCVDRVARYLNWRYFGFRKVQYECSTTADNSAYVVSRRERFYPTTIYATRIIDLVGTPQRATSLLRHEVEKAIQRGDAFLDFSYSSYYYDDVMQHLCFTELVGPHYGALPSVSSPIEYRENEEYICLGSKRFPHLFDDIEFNDLYFTRGDSDRDRYNGSRD